MKFDCETDEIFSQYNQPTQGTTLEEITEGLAQSSGITIQTLLSSGRSGNLDVQNIKEWIKRLTRKIK
ncbi:MAG: hypothetical protein ACE5LC_08380 [Candidatus Aminicenantales bacterium]